jgi:hypothetical protein
MSNRIVTWGAKGVAPVWELAAFVLRDFTDPVVEITGDDLESISRADWRLLEPELIGGTVRALRVGGRGQGPLSLTGPYFGGSLLGEWEAVLECSGIVAVQVYAQAKTDARMSFVAISIDDNPDIDSAAVTVESFPWLHWSLVVASVRDSGGGWIERNGNLASGQGTHRGKDPTHG